MLSTEHCFNEKFERFSNFIYFCTSDLMIGLFGRNVQFLDLESELALIKE